MTHTPKRPGDLNQLAKVIPVQPNVDLPDVPLREGGCNPTMKKNPALCRGFFNVSKDASRAYGNASRHSGLNARCFSVQCCSLQIVLRGGHIDGDHVYRRTETAGDRALRARRHAAVPGLKSKNI
jgi:hypothetical protein